MRHIKQFNIHVTEVSEELGAIRIFKEIMAKNSKFESSMKSRHNKLKENHAKAHNNQTSKNQG